MIGMIVVGAGPDHNVSLPLPDLADDLLADVESRQETTVMVVEHFVFDADSTCGLLCFGTAAHGERASTQRLMAGVAVGQRNEFHFMAERGVLSGESSRAQVAVVRVRAEGYDAYRFILGLRRQGRETQRSQKARTPDPGRHQVCKKQSPERLPHGDVPSGKNIGP